VSTDIPHQTRVKVRNRSSGVCERCDSKIATDMHHRMKRSIGGHSPENVVHLCRVCHDWAHANGVQARATGWIVPSQRRITRGDITNIPIRLRDTWALLTPLGDRVTIREAFAAELRDTFGLSPAVTA
jgi:hypothetical protein